MFWLCSLALFTECARSRKLRVASDRALLARDVWGAVGKMLGAVLDSAVDSEGCGVFAFESRTDSNMSAVRCRGQQVRHSDLCHARDR